MILEFRLSMPNPPTWDGRWSQEDEYFAMIKTFRNNSPQCLAVAKRILKTGTYIYRWDDGWTAEISVREVTRDQARKLRIKTRGFAGYEWMVTSIINHNEIILT